MRKLLFLMLLLIPWLGFSQTTYSWRNDQPGTASGGSWNNANNWWNGAANLPPGSEILFLDGNVGTTMTNNLPSTNRFKIIFGSTSAAARTIAGATANTFFEFGSTWPRIQNDATVTHTINFGINASTNSGFNLELAANAGPLVFGGLMNNNGRVIQIYGNNASLDAANRYIRLSGVLSGAGALNVSQFGTVKLNAVHTYTGQTLIDNGELWIETGGGVSASSGIFIGNGGQTANVAKLWLSNAAGGTSFSNNFTINNGNSGTRVVGGLNTSNINIFSGNIINNSSNLNLTSFNAGGTTDFQGVISGSNPILVSGGGTVKLSGVNTYSGGTTLSSGTLSIPANSALGTGSLTLGNVAVTSTIAITDNTTRSQGISVVDGSSAAVIDVLSAKNFELTGVLSQTGSNAATKIGKSGDGSLTLTGTATYVGQIQIGQGSVIVNNNSGLGTNLSPGPVNRGVDLGLNVGDVSQANNVALLVNNGFTVGQSVYVSANTSGATRTIGLNGSGAATFTNEIYLDGDLILNGSSGTVTISGNIVNTSGIVVSGGTVVLSGNNTYTGTTRVNSGILRLGASDRISSTSPIVLAGGTFSSGATTGFTDNLGTMNLIASTACTIALGTGSHSLTFANSSGLSPWGAGATLNITGWGGIAGQSNTTGGRVMVGVGGLTSLQLAKITFAGYTGTPVILGSGELVPPSPVLAVTAGSLTHATTCVNTAASTVTYTIANTGGNAAGISVSSNSAEFVVTNAATSITGGSTGSYQVTFTPSASGTRNATITINTTTPNSNAPVTSSISGVGNPLPTATIGGAATVCRNAAPPSITFTGANGTSNYTFTYQINGAGSFTATSSGNVATVAVPTGTAGVYTYSLVNVQDSSSTACLNAQTGSATVTVDAGTTYYADTDGDGYGAGAPIVSCTGQPGGTVTNNTDCAAGDITKWRTGSFYVDADNDGFYNGNDAITTGVCYGVGAPSGYVSDIFGTDCTDNNAEINPNHVEVLGNTLDDNCDGTADEVARTSYLQTAQCGTTLSHVSNTLYAFQLFEAQGYRFEVTGPTGPARSYDSATNAFTLTSLAGGITYNTTYAIRVALKIGGFWRAYGTSCNVTTPAVPATTNLVPTQCGATLTGLSNILYANQVPAASQYRFEVTGGVQGTRTFDSSFNRFTLQNLTGSAAYHTTYSVRVALFIGGVWQAYGTACDVTTPLSPPPTNLQPSQCGSTISNSWTTIYAIPVSEATGYRFEVFNGVVMQYIDTSVPRFNIHQIPAGYAANTAYTIRVAILFESVYQAFGSSCTFNTSAGLTKQAAPADAVFAVKAYPNPYSDTFKLDMETSGLENVEVKVFDMIGRQIDALTLSAADGAEIEVGRQYPSGVYNVIVTQGENVKTLRIIKR
jgi:autotransporter-associated beta strand protein